MSNIFLTTDSHLGHAQMVKFCGRPENHSELILLGYRNNLKEGDTLIHLGDICIGNDDAWHLDLKGYIPEGVKRILVRGNHDKKSDSWYLNHGWNFVCDEFSGHYFGKYVTFSHVPIPNAKNINIHGHFHNNLHRLLKKEFITPGEEDRNMALIENMNSNHRLLCIEDLNYRPVTLEWFLNNGKPFKLLDK